MVSHPRWTLSSAQTPSSLPPSPNIHVGLPELTCVLAGGEWKQQYCSIMLLTQWWYPEVTHYDNIAGQRFVQNSYGKINFAGDTVKLTLQGIAFWLKTRVSPAMFPVWGCPSQIMSVHQQCHFWGWPLLAVEYPAKPEISLLPEGT